MRGPYVLLMLIVGWVIMYFVLTLAIPEHLREQTDEMPGTRKSKPIVDSPTTPDPSHATPPASAPEHAISLLFLAPEGAKSLGLVNLQLYRHVGGKEVLDTDTSVLVPGASLRQSLDVSDPGATYTLRAASHAKGRPLLGPVTLEGLKAGPTPVEVRFPAKR